MSNQFGLGERINDAESKCLSCGAPLPKDREGQQKYTGGHTVIMILGKSDDVTTKLLDNAKEAVRKLGKDIEVTCVTEDDIINSYNVKKLPALVINGSIISQGIVSDADDIAGDIEFIV